MDGKYKRCLELAALSPCQKRGFGCLLKTLDGHWVETFNTPIDCAYSLCQSDCIRLTMKSGSDPLVGSCGHAEELAIWQSIDTHLSTKHAILYVAGVSKPDNNPLLIDKVQFYCLRCATTMYYAEVLGVNVWVNSDWVFMTAQEAYDSSLSVVLRK